MYFTLVFWVEFGVLGFFVGPFRTWTLCFYVVLAVIAWKMPDHKCVEKVDTIFGEDAQRKKDLQEDEESQVLNQIST